MPAHDPLQTLRLTATEHFSDVAVQRKPINVELHAQSDDPGGGMAAVPPSRGSGLCPNPEKLAGLFIASEHSRHPAA